MNRTNDKTGILWVVELLTQAGRIPAPRRWCSPSSRGPWPSQSGARPPGPSPSPQIHTRGWASRSPADQQEKPSHGGKCWSPGSGCNRWARRSTPSRSPWRALAGGRGDVTRGPSIYSLMEMSWWDGVDWLLCWRLCRSLSLRGLKKH